MENLPKPLLKLAVSGDPLDQSVAYKVGDLLAKGERKVHSQEEISNWKGLSKSERQVLTEIRKHMRERTSLKGGSKGWTRTTQEQIAAWCEYTQRHTNRIIAGLRMPDEDDSKAKKPPKRLGVLEIIDAPGKKQNTKGPGSKMAYAIWKKDCCFPKAKPGYWDA